LGNPKVVNFKITSPKVENAIALTQTPEEQELEKKLAELAALETAPGIIHSRRRNNLSIS
jgi:hypothetical protein